MRQTTLFTGSDLLTARSAKADPATSAQAAAALVRSGAHGAQCQQVLEALRQMVRTHGMAVTSAELARVSDLDRHMVAKRLSDLRRAGLVEQGPARLCAVGRRNAVTWRAAV